MFKLLVCAALVTGYFWLQAVSVPFTPQETANTHAYYKQQEQINAQYKAAELDRQAMVDRLVESYRKVH